MASEAQILANRRNAEKSTGPRTVEGKAVASQNAVTHGLLGKRDVISSESIEEFDGFREPMLRELNPSSPMETVLAERIISLSWRLKRVERMQNEALDCLLEEGALDSGAESGELGSFEQTADSGLGRAAVKDFDGSKVMDRLLMYERRIEHSLYKTMSELDRMKLLRPFDKGRGQGSGARDQGSGYGRLTPEPRPLSPATGSSCKTNPIPQSVGMRSGPAAVLIDAERPGRYRGPLDAGVLRSLGQSPPVAS